MDIKNIFRTRIIILFLFTIILKYSSSISAQSIIPWSKDIKLKWDDFKATPNTEVIAYAQTSYKIEILPSDVSVDSDNNIQNYESLTVIANFYTNHSWVYKKDDYLLKHEQLHFDIAGLYAIKINNEFKKLIEQKNANFDSYYGIYQKLWAKCRNTQKMFDSETNHGQLIEENKKWIQKITNEINSFLE